MLSCLCTFFRIFNYVGTVKSVRLGLVLDLGLDRQFIRFDQIDQM